jgi:hypothetical protein
MSKATTTYKFSAANASSSLLSLGLLAPVMFVVDCIDAYRIATHRFSPRHALFSSLYI